MIIKFRWSKLCRDLACWAKLCRDLACSGIVRHSAVHASDSAIYVWHGICLGDLHMYWQHTDMKEEMRTEAIEVIVSSVEKFAGKYDLAVSAAEGQFPDVYMARTDKPRHTQSRTHVCNTHTHARTHIGTLFDPRSFSDLHMHTHTRTLIDWYCFYYFVRNSPVALLKALCART